MHFTFTKEPLHIDDIVVYLKNERTGSSTIRKCKFIGQVIGFDKTRVKIKQFSKEDQFVTPEECKDYGEVLVYPHEIVNIIISKHYKYKIDVGCEHCRSPFKHSGQFYIATGLNNDPYLHIIRKEDSVGGAMIKYCPWCGRELDPWY